MPALTAVLESTPAQLSDGPEHKLRNTTLEILNRMPHTEALRPFDKQVLKLAMDALKAENEENALFCLRKDLVEGGNGADQTTLSICGKKFDANMVTVLSHSGSDLLRSVVSAISMPLSIASIPSIIPL